MDASAPEPEQGKKRKEQAEATHETNGDAETPDPKRARTQSKKRVADLFALTPTEGGHVTFHVGDGDEKESFRVPLRILVKNSLYFNAMFENDYKESREREMTITDFGLESFRGFIELLLALELQRSSIFIGLGGKFLKDWIDEVAPLVRYYQCNAAQHFLARQVIRNGTLESLAAFEEVFCDGAPQDWPDEVYRRMAPSCYQWVAQPADKPEVSAWAGCAANPSMGQGHVPGQRLGCMAKQELKPTAKEYMTKLRPQTLVKLMEYCLRTTLSIKIDTKQAPAR